jgi:septal ring factor EnvC (AmiA/AmiB activator)
MTTGAAKQAREEQPGNTGRLCFRASLLAAALFFATGVPAQTPETPDQNPQAAAGQAQAQADPAAELAVKRDSTRSELEALSKTINLSNDRVAQLQQSIDELEKSTSESLRTAHRSIQLQRRKALEKQITRRAKRS